MAILRDAFLRKRERVIKTQQCKKTTIGTTSLLTISELRRRRDETAPGLRNRRTLAPTCDTGSSRSSDLKCALHNLPNLLGSYGPVRVFWSPIDSCQPLGPEPRIRRKSEAFLQNCINETLFSSISFFFIVVF